MNLDEISRRLPMYVTKGFEDYGCSTVRVNGSSMGILIEDYKIYFKAICFHEDEEYAKRDKFLSFFTYTKLITLDDFYRITIYELHGFKNDIR